jgi:hypothetical protein
MMYRLAVSDIAVSNEAQTERRWISDLMRPQADDQRVYNVTEAPSIFAFYENRETANCLALKCEAVCSCRAAVEERPHELPMHEKRHITMIEQPTALRTLMEQHSICVLEGEERDLTRLPQDFDYLQRGACPVVEVRCDAHRSVFCRLELISRGGFYGEEAWRARFPDWEAYLLAEVLEDASEVQWYNRDYKHRSGILGWLDAYGSFGKKQNTYEWTYACRAMTDLEQLFGVLLLQELLGVACRIVWNTRGMDG